MDDRTRARDEAPEMMHAEVREATDAFAAVLNAAIERGLERKPTAPVVTSERPLPIYPHSLPTEGPPVPLFVPKPTQARRTVEQRQLDHLERHAVVQITRRKPDLGQFTILDVNDDHCRYAVTVDAPYLFCGAVTVEESVYCAAHDALCNRGFSGDRTKQAAGQYRQAFGGDAG